MHHGLGKLAVYTMPRFGDQLATMSHVTACALSAPHRARAACGRGPCPTAGQASSGPRWPGLFDTVVEPQWAKHVLCVWAELGFGPEAV
jgi:hypothetical protein